MTKTDAILEAGVFSLGSFEFWSLEFICYLRFVIWDLQYFKAHFSNPPGKNIKFS